MMRTSGVEPARISAKIAQIGQESGLHYKIRVTRPVGTLGPAGLREVCDEWRQVKNPSAATQKAGRQKRSQATTKSRINWFSRHRT